MVKDYYKILGISKIASANEIKRAYRKLAFQYHPDKNTDPSAQQLIQEINEAYNVLSNNDKRQSYDLRSHQPPRPKAPAWQTSPPTEPRPPKKKVKINRFDFGPYAYKGRLCSTFILGFTILLTVDYFISLKYHNTIVEDFRLFIHRSRRSAESYSYEIVSTKVDFTANTELGGIARGDTLDVDITPFFGIVKEILRSSTHLPIVKVINVYYPFAFIIVLALASCIVSLMVKRPESSFNFSIFNAVLFLILLYMSTQL